jgi:hypothetical protein
LVGVTPVAFGGLWQVPGCSPNSLFADTTVIGLRRGRDLRGRGRLGWARLHWRLDCLRWRDVALARRRHLRGRSPRASTGGWAACDGGALRWPKFGFCALQSATSCRLICGKGLPARRGCGIPRMMGAMQSTKRPSPDLAPPCTNPACSQAALTSAQARWRGAACTETAAPRPTRRKSAHRTPSPRGQIGPLDRVTILHHIALDIERLAGQPIGAST